MNTAFVSRLQELLAYYGLSSASFADKIGVPRSSISHLLSERNKPSLDFVMKVIKTFPEVNLYWLLSGKGSFPSKMNSPVDSLSSPTASKPLNGPTGNIIKQSPTTLAGSSEKMAVKVIVLYNDGSFESFDPRK